MLLLKVYQVIRVVLPTKSWPILQEHNHLHRIHYTHCLRDTPRYFAEAVPSAAAALSFAKFEGIW